MIILLKKNKVWKLILLFYVDSKEKVLEIEEKTRVRETEGKKNCVKKRVVEEKKREEFL